MSETIRERLEAFWSGKKTDIIPYTIYGVIWEKYKYDTAWKEMFSKGLGVVWHTLLYQRETPNLDIKTREYVENGQIIKKVTFSTPVGEIHQLFKNGWKQRYELCAPEDYKVMTYIVKNTILKPCYENYYKLEKESLPYMVPIIVMDRTPIQRILVDMAGLENFCYHLEDCEEEVMELYDALTVEFSRACEIVAEGPGKYVSVLENFTTETMGLERFKKYNAPIYKKYFPIIQASGKAVSTHFDGKLSCCAKIIQDSPIDIIESLTPPPEGDMTLKEARAAWPNKKFWSNISLSDYALEPQQLKDRVRELAEQALTDGRGLAFEISEDIPANWRESIPVVLDTLLEI